MKIIQVVGRSNSGKTTFIKQLIPILKTQGRVAVIKHLGDHEYELEEENIQQGVQAACGQGGRVWQEPGGDREAVPSAAQDHQSLA